MLGFIVRRCMSSVLVLTFTTMFVFALFYLGPRDPARGVCENRGNCTPERYAAVQSAMGLDKPVQEAFGTWVKGLVAGREVRFSPAEKYDCHAPCLGISYSSRQPVTDELKQKYPATLSIALGGAVLYLTIGVALGALAARFRGTTGDKLLVSTTLVASSFPYYLVALLAWIFLTQKWPVFPNTGYHPITENPALWFSGLLLPWLVLGLTNSTQYSRFTRGQMVETLGEDYIRTAVAKGQVGRVVIFKHALRAAIVPIVTIFGLDFGYLLGGTIFTERIFDIDGVGRWGLESITSSPPDIPVVTAATLISAVFIVTANLTVDIVYSFLDPRVKLS